MPRRPFEILHMDYLAHMHRKQCSTVFMKAGLTRGMPFMLCYLLDHEGCIQRDLAKHWHLDPATVTSVLTTMESQGYVTRRSVVGDKRALQVFLTEEGVAMAKLVDDTHALMDGVCFSGFSEEEKAAFKAALDRIEENLKQYDTSLEKESCDD